MYVWLRLVRMVATQHRRGPYRLGDESRLVFRCLPTDIDMNVHLNNARYMMLADMGRIDIFLRSGFLREGRKRGWVPLLGGVQVSYVREVRLWQRFEVLSSIETWEDTQIIGRHRFVLRDGQTAAMVMTTGGVYAKREKRFVPVAEVMETLGVEAAPRAPDDQEKAFLLSHQALRARAKTPASTLSH